MNHSKNRLYTKSYFLKRLRDKAFVCRSVDVRFAENDERKWMIVVDPEKTTIVVTCYKRTPTDFHFKIVTSRAETRVKTESMECMIAALSGLVDQDKGPVSSRVSRA